jgi:hypothetical protein
MVEIVNGFKSFGYTDEAKQVESFLKGIGVKQPKGDITFTPKDILRYQQLIQKKNYMQDLEFTKIFFKSLSNDGQKVTVDDMQKVLRELKMREEVASAEEYVERTVGQEKARAFNID